MFGNFDVMVPTVFDNGYWDSVVKAFDDLMNDSHVDYSSNFPPCNVFYREDNKGVEITLALAGYSKDELDISACDNKITIKATPVEEKEKSGRYFKQRIKKLPFEKTYELPIGKYNLDKAGVEYIDGLLTIYVPAREERKPFVKKLNIR